MDIVNKVWIILKSRFKKDNSEEQWVKDRREICRTCPYNSLNSSKRTFKQKVMKYLSDFYTWVTRSENEDLGECDCGCSIYFKTNTPEEVCYAKEKYGDDKWRSIYIPNSTGSKNGQRPKSNYMTSEMIIAWKYKP